MSKKLQPNEKSWNQFDRLMFEASKLSLLEEVKFPTSFLFSVFSLFFVSTHSNKL